MKRVEKIFLGKSEEQIRQDLERYREKAIELGASRAAVIPVGQIPVDERVSLKCRVPRCFGYGVSANCPPNTLTPAELQEYLKKYRWAVLFDKDVPSEVIVRNREHNAERVSAYQHIFKVVSEIESAAFYDGHYLAVGFGAGSCRHTSCYREKTCRAMEGEGCRFALTARPSMEAVGIDVYRMVTEVGWEIYPVGAGVASEQVTKGTLAGLVVVC